MTVVYSVTLKADSMADEWAVQWVALMVQVMAVQ